MSTRKPPEATLLKLSLLFLCHLLMSTILFSQSKNSSTLNPADTVRADSLKKEMVPHKVTRHLLAVHLDATAINNTKPAADSAANGDNRRLNEISQIIKEHNKSIEKCYQQLLKRDPALKGELVLRIFIHPDGFVEKVEIAESTMSDPAFSNTIVDIVRSWKNFGVTEADTTHVYKQTWVFRAENCD